jgi:hypothetical protein
VDERDIRQHMAGSRALIAVEVRAPIGKQFSSSPKINLENKHQEHGECYLKHEIH